MNYKTTKSCGLVCHDNDNLVRPVRLDVGRGTFYVKSIGPARFPPHGRGGEGFHQAINGYVVSRECETNETSETGFWVILLKYRLVCILSETE